MRAKLVPGDPAPQVDFTRGDGTSLALGELVPAAPTALLFLRHLG